jgi:hypothetical protein
VGVFAEAVLERVREAQAALKASLEAEDAFGADVARAELDDALRLAERHGIEVGGEEASAE